jgi:hypothetical protein
VGEPLLSRDSTLERVVASRRPLSLYFSRSLELRALAGAVAAAAVLGLARGWLTGAIVLAVAVALASLFVTRRIDLDTDGITLVPLLPVLRAQSLPFGALGSFETRESRPPTVSAPVDPSATFRLAGLFRRSRLSIRAVYDTAFADGVLGAAELRDIFEGYRGSATAAVAQPEAAPAVHSAAVGQNEWFAIFGVTVAGVFGVALVALLVVH